MGLFITILLGFLTTLIAIIPTIADSQKWQNQKRNKILYLLAFTSVICIIYKGYQENNQSLTLNKTITDLHQTISKKDSLDKVQIAIDSNRYNTILASIKENGYALDSNNKLVKISYTYNANSINQKGGQTAGEITNNN